MHVATQSRRTAAPIPALVALPQRGNGFLPHGETLAEARPDLALRGEQLAQISPCFSNAAPHRIAEALANHSLNYADQGAKVIEPLPPLTTCPKKFSASTLHEYVYDTSCVVPGQLSARRIGDRNGQFPAVEPERAGRSSGQ